MSDWLDDNDEGAEDDVVVDRPRDVFTLVEVRWRFPHHITQVATPEQETRLT